MGFRFMLVFYVVFSLTRWSSARTLGNETDRLALLTFKSQISGEYQWILSSWNTSSHFCEWDGVTCGRRHRRVIKLDLSSHGLIGPISPYIGNLSFVRNITLTNNMFHGHIPREIGHLSRLQDLNMENNALSGPLPVNLSECLRLVNLNLRVNKLIGKLPEEYGFFPKLTEIQLDDNHFTGEIPASFGNLSSIEDLAISNNSLTGGIPDSLGQLTRIWGLGLGVNMLSGTLPSSLYNISSLEVIALNSNQFEGTLARDIGLRLPKLYTFYIGSNNFSGTIPISLFTNTSDFGFLDLSVNLFSGQVPVEVGSRKSLRILSLYFNNFGSGGEVDDLIFLTSLNNCTKLREIGILYNNFGGRLPSSIANLSSKEPMQLRLGYNPISGRIPHDIGNLDNLIDLSIPYTSLSDEIPISIGFLQNLQVLSLKGNYLSGRIPRSLGNLSAIYTLDLSDNALEGNITANFEHCQGLQRLYFSDNRLSGIVSKEVLGLSRQVTEIFLSRNYFSGLLPSEVGNLINLRVIDVSENRIVGQIPSTLGSCLVLEELRLDGNHFQGVIPSTFKYLKGLQVVNLSRNNLSGNIPKDLENFPYLRSLNLSFNNFEGEVPKEGIFRNATAFSIVGNHRLCGGDPKLKLPSCTILRSSNKKKKHLVLKVALSGVLLLSILIIATISLLLYTKKMSTSAHLSEEFGNSLEQVSYNELHKATNGFSFEYLIGSGSYGSVYKGSVHGDKSIIAVKVLNLMQRGSLQSFIAECEVLREVRHRNLLKILTVCSSIDFNGNDFRALIFEFMSNGSLDSWLHPTSNEQHSSRSLDILQRLNIAIDVASALDYLHNHCETPVVHCDLKPSNVLLNENMVACVGDFGLAKFLYNNGTYTSSSIAIRGTIGYIPPEGGMGAEVSTKWDVYSYGILILELFTGKTPTDSTFSDGLNLRSFCKENLATGVLHIMDERLLGEEILEDKLRACLISVLKIGLACSSELPVERIEIGDVLVKMQAIRDVYKTGR
ncbi:hypothetical protein ACHQM5_028420 [Ranunculus cassubicifolius]